MGSPRFVGDKKLFDFTLIFIRFHGSFCGRMWLRRKLNTSMSAAQCPNHREPPTPQDENWNESDFPYFFHLRKKENLNNYLPQMFSYLNVISTMSQSPTSHPSRWKLQCSQYDFPYEMEYYGKSQWLCPSSIFPLELLHLQDKLCGQTVTYLISLHVSGGDFTWWWFWWTYWWWWWWLAITKPGTMMTVMLTRETGQRFVVQYRLCVDSL